MLGVDTRLVDFHGDALSSLNSLRAWSQSFIKLSVEPQLCRDQVFRCRRSTVVVKLNVAWKRYGADGAEEACSFWEREALDSDPSCPNRYFGKHFG